MAKETFDETTIKHCEGIFKTIGELVYDKYLFASMNKETLRGAEELAKDHFKTLMAKEEIYDYSVYAHSSADDDSSDNDHTLLIDLGIMPNGHKEFFFGTVKISAKGMEVE